MVMAKIFPHNEEVRIEAGDALVFDTVTAMDGTAISYSDQTGVITFNDEGFYYIDWFVATQTGLALNGSNWAIVTTISDLEFIGSSHTKISPTSGFALINAAVGETVKLENISDEALVLSGAVKSKAGLSVYSL
jgi:hypothetical protein